MSFHEAFVWTLLRSVAAALLAVPMSSWLSRLVRRSTGQSRFWWMLFVFCPLVAPDLIVGYSYRSFELSLLHRPNLNHCFYFVLVVLKFLPAAVLVRICLPPPLLSKSALHSVRLSGATSKARQSIQRVSLKTDLLRNLPVFGIVFLLTMQEFEIASLLQIPAWTVHLFDSQAGGLDSMTSLRLLVSPVLVQAAVLIPLIWWGLATSRNAALRWRAAEDAPRGNMKPGVAIAAVAAVLTWGVPLSVVSLSGIGGLGGVLRNEILVRSTFLDLTAAIAIAVPCSVLSLILARKLNDTTRRHEACSKQMMSKLRPVLLTLLVAPGLFGSLAVSIVVLSAIQYSRLTELRATVWPMSLALILFLAPRALVMTMLLPVFRNSEASHLSTLLSASSDSTRRNHAAQLKWWCECRPLFLVAAVLFYWSLANLTAAALLCPPTIPLLSFDGNIVPLPVRLYKFIHQGRTATLSVMALLSVIVPLVLIVVAAQVAPRIYIRMSRSGVVRP
jgi:ABC-type Fe3+ transport system permease subunit